jgi:ribose 5-phosphate isomerase B
MPLRVVNALRQHQLHIRLGQPLRCDRRTCGENEGSGANAGSHGAQLARTNAEVERYKSADLRPASQTALLYSALHSARSWREAALMKIAIGTDHAGFRYKEAIKEMLISAGHEVQDFGAHSETQVDYPDFVRPAALAVARGEAERGIVLGGSGNGEAMVANRVKGIRCGLCWNVESAVLTRQHNNSNVLSLGQRMMSLETALEIVRVWLETPFEGGRHQQRIEKIDAE